MAESKKRWYVLRAISGKEAKVKEVLDASIKNTDLGKHVSQVLIPTEKKYTTTPSGKKVLREHNLYSGYVFVEANLTGEVIYELRNTTNVIDFLRGRAKNSDPVPLTADEVARMLGRQDEANNVPVADVAENYLVGESVKVNYGPFNGFTGTIKEVDTERNRVKVEVKIFGRGNDLTLEISQVEKV